MRKDRKEVRRISHGGKLLKSINGKYFPSFFTIFVDANISPEDYLKAENIPTIIHEYIHFIQDISTVYGLSNLSNTFSDIAYFYNITEKNISLPYYIKSESGAREINKDLFSVYFSETDYTRIPKENISVSINESPVSKIGIDNFDSLNYYTVHVKKDAYQNEFDFGACAIMEGMARIIERYLYIESDKKYWEIPYDLPEIVVKNLYPEYSESLQNIFALCDASLMYFHPGEVFIKMVYLMKENSFIPKTVNEVYSFVHQHLIITGIDFYTFWNKIVLDASNHITNVVNVSEYNFAKNWAIESLNYYYNLRRNNPAFLSEILTYPSTKAQIELINIFKNFTSPVIYNKKNEFAVIGNRVISADDQKKIFYWFNMSKFYIYVFKKSKSCPFESLCFEDCSFIKEPYKRNGSDYCLFQQYSRVFGLYKREIQCV